MILHRLMNTYDTLTSLIHAFLIQSSAWHTPCASSHNNTLAALTGIAYLCVYKRVGTLITLTCT
eukprot:c37935_g1_i1 orf=20-211(-)